MDNNDNKDNDSLLDAFSKFHDAPQTLEELRVENCRLARKCEMQASELHEMEVIVHKGQHALASMDEMDAYLKFLAKKLMAETGLSEEGVVNMLEQYGDEMHAEADRKAKAAERHPMADIMQQLMGAFGGGSAPTSDDEEENEEEEEVVAAKA